MPERTLLVIDMQNGFTRYGALADRRQEAVIEKILPIVADEVGRGSHVIFTKDTHTRDDPGINAFGEHCVVGTPGHDIVDELLPFTDGATLVEKPRYSALFQSDLDEVLASRPPEVIRVVGVAADVCVMHTVADLRIRDYAVEVVAEGIETFDRPDHDAVEAKRWALNHMRTVLRAEIV